MAHISTKTGVAEALPFLYSNIQSLLIIPLASSAEKEAGPKFSNSLVINQYSVSFF